MKPYELYETFMNFIKQNFLFPSLRKKTGRKYCAGIKLLLSDRSVPVSFLEHKKLGCDFHKKIKESQCHENYWHSFQNLQVWIRLDAIGIFVHWTFVATLTQLNPCAVIPFGPLVSGRKGCGCVSQIWLIFIAKSKVEGQKGAHMRKQSKELKMYTIYYFH